MNCSGRLKEETSKAHLHTEKLLLKKLKAMRSIQDYQHILKIFYGFFHPVELLISEHINPSILPDYTLRGASDKIANDLAMLNNVVPLPVSAAVPQIRNIPQAAGAMYVIEGSTLGGQVIARMIRENPGIQVSDDALTFFRGHDDNTIPMWKTFQGFLNDRFTSEAQIREVTSAATETFSKMSEWIETC